MIVTKVIVITWLHLSDRRMLKVHPQDNAYVKLRPDTNTPTFERKLTSIRDTYLVLHL